MNITRFVCTSVSEVREAYYYCQNSLWLEMLLDFVWLHCIDRWYYVTVLLILLLALDYLHLYWIIILKIKLSFAKPLKYEENEQKLGLETSSNISTTKLSLQSLLSEEKIYTIWSKKNSIYTFWAIYKYSLINS